MGRFDPAGRQEHFGADTVDTDFVATDAWAEAFDRAGVQADFDDEPDAGDADPGLDEEDDLMALIMHRPSRRTRTAPTSR